MGKAREPIGVRCRPDVHRHRRRRLGGVRVTDDQHLLIVANFAVVEIYRHRRQVIVIDIIHSYRRCPICILTMLSLSMLVSSECYRSGYLHDFIVSGILTMLSLSAFL